MAVVRPFVLQPVLESSYTGAPLAAKLLEEIGGRSWIDQLLVPHILRCTPEPVLRKRCGELEEQPHRRNDLQTSGPIDDVIRFEPTAAVYLNPWRCPGVALFSDHHVNQSRAHPPQAVDLAGRLRSEATQTTDVQQRCNVSADVAIRCGAKPNDTR